MVRLAFAMSLAAIPVAVAGNIAPPVAPVVVEMHAISEKGGGDKIGVVELTDTPAGLSFSLKLAGLPPGDHGFHVHEKGDCGPALKDGKMTAGQAAGAHYDPDGHAKHLGPKGEGHRGDLEILTVAADGTAKKAFVSSRLKLADVAGRALMIHAGGDNFSDQPLPLGGGGARIACGVVPAK